MDQASGSPGPRRAKVSLADVARRAGVSTQTVSRVVNNSSAVRPQTRERVLEAIRQLGYRPSFAGRTLRLSRYQAVGLALSNAVSTGNVNRLGGIMEAASSRGYAITLVQAAGDAPEEIAAIGRRMASLPVDAMIYNLNRTYLVDSFLAFEPLPHLRCIAFSSIAHPRLACIDADQAHCARSLTEHLIVRGHRSIAMVAGPADSIASCQREQAWRTTLEEHGLERREPLRGDWSATSGYEAGLRLAHDPELSAVFAANDEMAMGVIAALRDAGRAVPHEVSVVGADDSLTRSVPKLELTSYAFADREIGRLAFEAAVDDEHGVGLTLVPGELVERSSVRDLR